MSLYISNPAGCITVELNSESGIVELRLKLCESFAELLTAHAQNADLFICMKEHYLRPGESLVEFIGFGSHYWSLVAPVKDRKYDRVQRWFVETSLREITVTGIGKLGCENPKWNEHE